jgi:hypothetical protein
MVEFGRNMVDFISIESGWMNSVIHLWSYDVSGDAVRLEWMVAIDA